MPKSNVSPAREAPPDLRPLVQRALAGNAPATRELLDKLRPAARMGVADALRRHTPRASWRHEEVDELTQEVLFAFFDKGKKLLREWNPAVGPLPGYVKFIARNRAISHLRARENRYWEKNDVNADGGPTMDGFEQALEQKEIVDAAREAAAEGLTPSAKRVFRLLFNEFLSVNEVSARTGMKPANVHTVQSRYLKRIREAAQRILGDVVG